MTDPNAARFAAVVEQVFDTIEQMLDAQPYPPTRAEVAEHLGIAETTVRRAVTRLKADGRLGEGKGARTLFIKY